MVRDAGRLLATLENARATWGNAHGHIECESLRNLTYLVVREEFGSN
jgi:hypothetical protein